MTFDPRRWSLDRLRLIFPSVRHGSQLEKVRSWHDLAVLLSLQHRLVSEAKQTIELLALDACL